MKTLTIQDERSNEGKGRQFRAAMLGYMTADMLWDGGMTVTNNMRPIYVTLAGTEAALRPFLANVRKGRKVYVVNPSSYRSSVDGRIEFLRSAGYEYIWQRGKNLSLVTAYQPGLFQADPGMIDHQMVSFISAPPQWWVAEQGAMLPAADVERVAAHLRRLGVGQKGGVLPAPISLTAENLREVIPVAAHFCLFLDKRTRRPLINDLAFTAQLYLAALHIGAASYSNAHRGQWGAHNWAGRGFDEYMTGRLGFYPAAVVNLSQENMDEFLAQQIKLWRGE